MVEITYKYIVHNIHYFETMKIKYKSKNKAIQELKKLYDNVKILNIRRVGA